MPGVLTISLDFELHWGGFEKWPLYLQQADLRKQARKSFYNQYFLNTRTVIPEMLKLFEKYKVHVTWAGVGLLMHVDRNSMIKNFPELKPSYAQAELSAYNYIEQYGIGEGEEDDPFHYAHSLVKQIVATPWQELGSHTFSHYYCNEEGQTPEQFRADLKAAQKAASAYGVRLRSLVFPRNQFNDQYLKICAEEGINSVRSNPPIWFWKINTRQESIWKRINRGIDAYFPLAPSFTYKTDQIDVRPRYPICLPASRLLRPFRPEEALLNRLKLKRIVQEMEYAAKHDEVYHLWWHPHNFGHYPEQNLRDLEVLLEQFKQIQNRYGMVSMNMNELTNHILQSHADQ